jgi:hypothetical protein
MSTFASLVTQALQAQSYTLLEQAMAEHNRMTAAENIIYWRKFDEIRRARKEDPAGPILDIYIGSLKYDLDVINRDQGRREVMLKRYTALIVPAQAA